MLRLPSGNARYRKRCDHASSRAIVTFQSAEFDAHIEEQMSVRLGQHPRPVEVLAVRLPCVVHDLLGFRQRRLHTRKVRSKLRVTHKDVMDPVRSRKRDVTSPAIDAHQDHDGRRTLLDHLPSSCVIPDTLRRAATVVQQCGNRSTTERRNTAGEPRSDCPNRRFATSHASVDGGRRAPRSKDRPSDP